MTVRRVVNLYLHAMRSNADEKRLDAIEAALEPPNRYNPDRGAPEWWTSEEDAWAEWEVQARKR